MAHVVHRWYAPDASTAPGCSTCRTGHDCHSHNSSDTASSEAVQSRNSTVQRLSVGSLRLDPARREVRRGDHRVELSAKEFALLEALMRRPGEVLTRLELIEQAWDFAYEIGSNIVDVYIRRLRRKLDEPFGTSSLETVRSVGYRLRVDQ